MTTPQILVVGDLMVDVCIMGTSRRGAPEAPDVPVMMLRDEILAPGGAGNVAVNIGLMGGKPGIVGAIGDDAMGRALVGIFRDSKAGLLILPRSNVPTTVKTRFFCDDKMRMRMDSEKVNPLTDEETARMLTDIAPLIQAADALVISDYNKGVVTPELARGIIAMAKDRGIPIVVDTKRPMAQHFDGATAIKINLPEAAAAIGGPIDANSEDIAGAATMIQDLCGVDYVIITAGGFGMTLAGADSLHQIAGHDVDVVDVTGAGDAVAAALALSLACGYTIENAARFANAGGAVVVGKRGTTGPTLAEILALFDPTPAAAAAPQERAGAESALVH